MQCLKTWKDISVSYNKEMTDHQLKVMMDKFENLTAQNTVFLEICSLKGHVYNTHMKD